MSRTLEQLQELATEGKSIALKHEAEDISVAELRAVLENHSNQVNLDTALELMEISKALGYRWGREDSKLKITKK